MSTADWEKSLKRWDAPRRSAASITVQDVKADEVDLKSSRSFAGGIKRRLHPGLRGLKREGDMTMVLNTWRSSAKAKAALKAKKSLQARGGPKEVAPNHSKSTDIGDRPRLHLLPEVGVRKGSSTRSRLSSTNSFQDSSLGLVDHLEAGEPLTTTSRVSPTPTFASSLPEGVECIDPQDDSTLSYPADHVLYLKGREQLELAERKGALGYLASRVLHNRVKLSGWLVVVAHYLHCSQETLYQTINLLDKVMERFKFRSSETQAIGIACLLVATKLEEYTPADLDVLVKLADMSYTRAELIKTEAEVLRVVKFETWTVEPMGFLRWFIRAAMRDGDDLFLELCTFLVDTFIMEYDLWKLLPSLKAAAAVYAALKLFPDKSGSHCWTRTLAYYTGYEEDTEDQGRGTISLAKNILPGCALRMLELLDESLKSLERKSDDYRAQLAEKYHSNSRHRGLLKAGIVSKTTIELAMRRVRIVLASFDLDKKLDRGRT